QARIGTARAHAPSCPAGRAGDWWSVPGASDAPRCLPIRCKQSQRVPKPRPRLRASAHRDQCPPPCRRWTAPRVFADAQTRRPCTGTLAHPRPASGTIGRTNMLHDFLEQNRARLIERCRSKVLLRRAPPPTPGELEHGIPLFLGQLIDVLRIEERYGPRAERRPATPGSPPTHLSTEIDETATKHGSEMLLRGFTINQVVHDYGDLCQSITELAAEGHAEISVDEFNVLNRCLDDGIAEAVTSYQSQRERQVAETQRRATGERLGSVAHELRNLVGTATLAFEAMKAGMVGAAGPTSAVLGRSLSGMRDMINRTLAEVR